MIFYNYEGYFGKPKPIKEEEDQKPTGPDTGGFDYAKWQWHLMVHKLVQELQMKPDLVYEMNYIDCLNWLSMFNDRDTQIERIKKQMK